MVRLQHAWLWQNKALFFAGEAEIGPQIRENSVLRSAHLTMQPVHSPGPYID